MPYGIQNGIDFYAADLAQWEKELLLLGSLDDLRI